MMEAYRFQTIIQKDGVVKIPEIAKWANQQAEIFVVIIPTAPLENETVPIMANFLDKWRGFLKGFDPDELKSQYLQEKYG